MSAFVVSDEHINALISYARDCQVHVYGFGSVVAVRGSEQKMAELLLAENIKSVCYRYKDEDSVPPPIKYRHRAVPLKPIEVIKACHCLDYQSCEHPEWKASMACALVKAILDVAICKLPGYNEAAWGLPAPERKVA